MCSVKKANTVKLAYIDTKQELRRAHEPYRCRGNPSHINCMRVVYRVTANTRLVTHTLLYIKVNRQRAAYQVIRNVASVGTVGPKVRTSY